MPRNNYGRSFGDKPGYRPPNRVLDERDAAAERRREAQPPTEDPPRGNQQASNARGRAIEPASNNRRDRSASRGRSPRGRSRRDGSPARNDGHRGGSAPHGNDHGRSRPPQMHQGGRPHDSRGRRQDKVARREPRLNMVPEMELVHYSGAQGQDVVVDAVNRSLGGGHQNNIAALTPTGFMIKSTVANHAARLIKMGMANGASGYVAKIDMIYEDDVARARKNKQLTQNIESSLGRPRPKVRLPNSYFGQGPALAERITEPQTPADEPAAQREGQVVDVGDMGEYQCENCPESGHNMVRCLKVPEGALNGCTLCHSRTHYIDECNTFLAMPLQQQVKVLVFDRFSMPPLRTKEHWFQWLRRWLADPGSRNKDGDAYVPTGFPWSEKFTADLGQGFVGDVDALQEEFDQHKDVARLPRDPATADFDAADKTYGLAHIHPDDPSTLRRAVDGRFGQPAPVEKAGESAASNTQTVHGSLDFDIDMDTAPME
ncbi:hypothetical protein MRS44_009759 [Fusarium solani]|uniref:uncharacterized protein n=1 Tax=Fusarium solani TaxID=169388 RepID=UPI0032C43851|nr:hypothetical protein MRS44_009759 [Fusarium solani]